MSSSLGEVGSSHRLWRSRWAAIGAAVAVTLGGGGMFAVQAASSVPSSVVTIDPVRILDTRSGVGLPGPFVSLTSRKLQVTGGAVPAGATGVLLNVTVASPTADGFVSVRPGDATGAPSTSSLNFIGGIPAWANAVQVGLPTTGANVGKIDITYDAFGTPGEFTDVLIDVVGYMTPATGSIPAPPPRLSDYRVVDVKFTLLPQDRTVAQAECPPPLRVLSGGFSYSGTADTGDIQLQVSNLATDYIWAVEVYNWGTYSPTGLVTVICAA